jgi:hypothetical protein
MNHKTNLLILIAALITLSLPAIAAVKEMWIHYESETGVFKTRAPEQAQTKITNFMIGDKLAASSEETTAVIDERTSQNVIKTYIIKFDQTLGVPLNDIESDIVLNQEMALYEDFYTKGYKGVTTKKEKKTILNSLGGELVMNFEDPKLGPQSIKIVTLVTPQTRLQQIAMGPPEMMNSFKTRDYFNSTQFFDGLTVTDKSIENEWKQARSPLNTFTYFAPTVTPPYYPETAKANFNPREDNIAMTFKDPVRNQPLYYNIYSYRFDVGITPDNAKTVIQEKHLKKFVDHPSAYRFTFSQIDEQSSLIEGAFNVSAPKGYPWIDRLTLKARLVGNALLVEEVIGSAPLVASPFAQNISKMIEFHPGNYQVPSPGQSIPGMTDDDVKKALRIKPSAPPSGAPANPPDPAPAAATTP